MKQTRLRTDDELLSSSIAARELAMPQATLLAWANQGKIAAIRIANGWRLFKRSDIERFKQEREKQNKQ